MPHRDLLSSTPEPPGKQAGVALSNLFTLSPFGQSQPVNLTNLVLLNQLKMQQQLAFGEVLKQDNANPFSMVCGNINRKDSLQTLWAAQMLKAQSNLLN